MTQSHFHDLLSKLEQPLGDAALSWVAAQNHKTIAQFTQSRRFQQMQQLILTSLFIISGRMTIILAASGDEPMKHRI